MNNQRNKLNKINNQNVNQQIEFQEQNIIAQQRYLNHHQNIIISKKKMKNCTLFILFITITWFIINIFKNKNQIESSKKQHLFAEEHKGDDKHLTFPYPTAGMRTPGVPFDFTQVDFGQDYYNFQKQLNQYLKPYNDTNCILERIGNKDYDGGYAYCTNFMEDTKALINLGIEARDLLGCEFVKKHLIPNYQYDCTTDKKPSCQPYDHMNIYSPSCIGAIPQNLYYKFESFKSIIDKNGLFGKNIIIKSDVQGGEWIGFRTIPMSYLDHIDQIMMEVHLPGRDQFHKVYKGDLDTMKSLSQKFVSVNMHMTSFACQPKERLQKKERFFKSFAIEVTLVNKRLIKLNSESRSYAIGSDRKINVINWGNYSKPDCQMQD